MEHKSDKALAADKSVAKVSSKREEFFKGLDKAVSFLLVGKPYPAVVGRRTLIFDTDIKLASISICEDNERVNRAAAILLDFKSKK